MTYGDTDGFSQLEWENKLKFADQLFAKGELAKGEEIYLAAIVNDPGCVRAHIGLAHCARRRGQHAVSLGHFQAAVRLAPNAHGVQLEVATDLRELGRLDEAEAICREVAEVAPNDAQAHIGLAHCARRRGDRISSLNYFQAANRLLPSGHGICLEVVIDLNELGWSHEAEKFCYEVLDATPDDVQAYMGLAYCARKRGNRTEAMAHLKSAINVSPNNIPARLEIANEQRESGDFKAARETALTLLEKYPLNLEAMLSLAQIERAEGRFDASLKVLEKAHSDYPLQVGILVELAIDERQLGHPEKCEKYLRQALEHNPFNVRALLLQAEQAMLANDIEMAKLYFERASTDQPFELSFHLGRLEALAKLGKVDDAISGFQALENVFGYASFLCARRASLLRHSGRYYEALQLAQEATSKFPHDFGLWTELFFAELMVGEESGIEICLQNMPADTITKRANVEHFKGILAENRWRIEEAIRFYEKAEIMNRQDPSIQHDLVRAKLLIMDFSGARVHLQRANEIMRPYLKMRGEPLNVSQSHLGQVWDDYYLDQEVAKTLVQLQKYPPAARVIMLAGVVGKYPDSTASAVNLMVALRQSGAFQGVLIAQGQKIPKIIAQFWDSDNPPEDIEKIMASWPLQNPGYKIKRFSDARAKAWLAQNCSKEVLLAYRRASEPAKKADIFRLAFLAVEGGIYADADDRCIKPIETIIPGCAEIVLWQESFGTIGNNFIAVSPNHQVIRRALDLVVTSVNRGDSDILWLSTGPGLMTRALSQVLVESGSSILPWTVVLNRRELSKVVAIHCSAGYKMTKQHWLNSAFVKRSHTARPTVASDSH